MSGKVVKTADEKELDWKCDVCGKVLTIIEGTEYLDQVNHISHIDIMRSKKQLMIDDGEIVEELEESNVKMHRRFCTDCFTKILSESWTLGQLFLEDGEDHFIF